MTQRRQTYYLGEALIQRIKGLAEHHGRTESGYLRRILPGVLTAEEKACGKDHRSEDDQAGRKRGRRPTELPGG